MAEADPAGPADAADADMLTSLTLLWPGYFAQPGTAPAIPPGLRASMAGYVGTFVSMSEHLADGSLASALRQLRVPAIFLLGAQSPMPVSPGEQAAALLPGDRSCGGPPALARAARHPGRRAFQDARPGGGPGDR